MKCIYTTVCRTLCILHSFFCCCCCCWYFSCFYIIAVSVVFISTFRGFLRYFFAFSTNEMSINIFSLLSSCLQRSSAFGRISNCWNGENWLTQYAFRYQELKAIIFHCISFRSQVPLAATILVRRNKTSKCQFALRRSINDCFR